MQSGHRPSGAVGNELADQSSRHTINKRTPNIAERFRPSRNLYTEKTILSAALTSLARQANDRRKPTASPLLGIRCRRFGGVAIWTRGAVMHLPRPRHAAPTGV